MLLLRELLNSLMVAFFISRLVWPRTQPRTQGFSLKKWVGREKALALAGHVSPRTPQNPGCNKLASCEKLKLCVTSHRAILGGLLYLLIINERFFKISFSSQILATVLFFAFLRFLWGGQRVTFVKPLFIERYKWQTSYHTCIKYVPEKAAFSTLLIFYFISCEVGRRTQPSSIHLNSQRHALV